MTEYIVKEQALEAILSAIELTGEQWAQVWNKIKQTPAAEIAPVVHARWEETDWETWSCTHCGIEWQFLDGMTPEENDAFYCPQCGARMDGR